MQTTNDPRKEEMGRRTEQNDREKVERAEEHERSDGSTSLGREQDHQESGDIIPAQQEEDNAARGAGYEEFIQDESSRTTGNADVERDSLAADARGDVERERPVEGSESDVERESIAGDDYRGEENPT